MLKPALFVLSSLQFSDPTDKSQYGEEQDSGYDSDMYAESSIYNGHVSTEMLIDD